MTFWEKRTKSDLARRIAILDGMIADLQSRFWSLLKQEIALKEERDKALAAFRRAKE